MATIAVCTYNRIGTIRKTMEAARRLRGRYQYEIVVVNGPSTDGTGEYLQQQSDIRVFDNPVANLSISRNIAIANASGKYISFIDDDAIPEPEWLDRIVSAMEADTSLSALGGFIRDANGMEFQAKYVFADGLGRGYPCDNPDYATFISRDKTLYLSLTGTNVTFRRDDIVKLGGFDEVFAYFLDETDVNKRMFDAGMKMGMLPSAEIHHKYAASHLRTEKKIATNMQPIARSIAYFALRHGVAEFGWTAVSKYIQEFYYKELGWKSDTVRHGGMTATDFRRIMEQLLQGIIEGIDLSFDQPAEPAADRLTRHQRPGSPRMLAMRRAEDTLRLCMLSKDHARERPAGIGTWTNLVAKGLAERGHEVTVIGELEKDDGVEYADYTEDNYWSHNVGRFGSQSFNEVDCLGLPSSLADPSKRKLAEINRIKDQRSFQLVSSPIWDVEGAAGIGSGLPTVLSLHTCVGLVLEMKPEWRANEDYYRNHILKVVNAEIQALKRSKYILANSQAIVKDIERIYGIDIRSRPHGVVPHGLDDIERPMNILDMRIAKDFKRILYLGRLERRKGASHMAEVVDRILAAREEVIVDIVGEKVDATEVSPVLALLEKYPARVTYHGFLDDEAVDRLMRQSDIFLAPSLYESFGLIYAEAARYSIPSVAYATGGVPEVVQDGRTGFLAELGDRKGLFDALLKLVDDRSTLMKMSRAARDTFEAEFHYRVMGKRIEAAYRDAAKLA
jgi:glycosyltransferase involved in cell wall biosynthesis